MYGIARPFFVGLHRENAGHVQAAFADAVSNQRAAADGGFIGDLGAYNGYLGKCSILGKEIYNPLHQRLLRAYYDQRNLFA